MSDPISTFTTRLYTDWLPSFCSAPHRNYSTAGFKDNSIKKLSEFDARWFLNAVDSGLVTELDGFFTAPKSKAKEQIFWTGRKVKIPRPITLWIEPIITIGALARLNKKFGWPCENLGTQSQKWAFDLVCYGNTSDDEHIVCEVKKHPKEIIVLLEFMNFHCARDPMDYEPTNAKERNAYRKVQGVRRSWPSVFWALGPRGEGQVFRISRDGVSQRFSLEHDQQSALNYENALRRWKSESYGRGSVVC